MYYGKKVILRGLELSDVDSIMKSWNNLELRRTLAQSLPVTREEELEWIRKSWKERSAGTSYQFAITDHKNNFLGTTGFFSINKISRSAELGIAIYDIKNRGKGYGTDAVITLCAIGFNILNFHTIRLNYIENNKAAKAYYRAGFQEIGRMRDAIFKHGEYLDLIYMDIIENEFRDKFSEYTLFRQE